MPEIGSYWCFVGYAGLFADCDPLFGPGQFVMAGGPSTDGGWAFYPVDSYGVLTGEPGDTLFPEEVVHLSYMRPRPEELEVAVLEGRFDKAS